MIYRIKGSLLITILLVIAGAIGIGLWYTIEKAYYINVSDISEINVAGTIRKVQNYNGIDADTSPLKLRACFEVDWKYNFSADYKNIATPLIAPKAFSCFDAKKIGFDIQAENASVILNEKTATAMGNYFFTQTNGIVVKVEYTFGYFLNEKNDLKINVHHSSLPYVS